MAPFVASRVNESRKGIDKGTHAMNKMSVTLFAMTSALLIAQPAFARSEAAMIDAAAAELAPNDYVWTDTAPPPAAPGQPSPVAMAQPVTLVVSLPLQRAYLYRGDVLVAASTVSTGRDGNDTPTGIYPILQKNKDHRSNIYDGAPMPYMQRLTWDGIALHAGNNPGFPDSHGCVRLPAGFAKKLFGVTTLGTTVVITDEAVVGDRLDRSLLQTDSARANAAQIAALDR